MKFKRRYKLILGIAIILIAFRMVLPFLLKNYINGVLDDIPEHTGSVEDVDVSLFRGAYVLKDLRIVKESQAMETPFFAAESIDISLQWKALFSGAVVGELIFTSPQIHLIESPNSNESQMGDADWTKPLKELLPIRINRLEVRNGQVDYFGLMQSPDVDIYINEINATAENISNVEHAQDSLPSSVFLTGSTEGGGAVTVKGYMDLLRQVPNLDLNISLEHLSLPAVNDFFQAYASLDMEEGEFHSYAELLIWNGEIKGYVKPLFRDIKVVDWQKDSEKPLELIWESMAGVVLEIFENQQADQFATRAPFEGTLNQSDADVS